MIDFNLDPKSAILTVRPESALDKDDFVGLAMELNERARVAR